jgi:outer membrane receptor protein involved in Fe transport
MAAPDRCTTPGYTLVDLHLGWHKLLNGKATLWLDIYNLFDKRYYAAGGSGSRTFWDMPQQPRTWMLTLDYPF